jgi:hypothetical protein
LQASANERCTSTVFERQQFDVGAMGLAPGMMHDPEESTFGLAVDIGNGKEVPLVRCTSLLRRSEPV